MKAYVISRGHAPRMHTAAWLGKTGLDVTVVCDTLEEQKAIAAAMPYVRKSRIILTGTHGCLNARNFILSELVHDGEWHIGIDDNVQHLDIVAPSLYVKPRLPVAGMPPRGHTWRSLYRHAIPPATLPRHLHYLRAQCVHHHTIYGGYASTENPMFRANHFGYRRFVKTKLYVLQKTPGLQFKGGDYAHDSWMSAYTVAEYGKVVVDNYIHPRYPWYEPGGLGKISERRAKLDVILDDIIAEFPGLVVKAKGANSALKFVRTSDAAVAKWRATVGRDLL